MRTRDPGWRLFGSGIRKEKFGTLELFPQNVVTKFSNICVQDPGSEIRDSVKHILNTGSRGQKGTRSQIRIRNTVQQRHNILTHVHLPAQAIFCTSVFWRYSNSAVWEELTTFQCCRKHGGSDILLLILPPLHRLTPPLLPLGRSPPQYPLASAFPQLSISHIFSVKVLVVMGTGRQYMSSLNY